jgi:hypothetical protein
MPGYGYNQNTFLRCISATGKDASSIRPSLSRALPPAWHITMSLELAAEKSNKSGFIIFISALRLAPLARGCFCAEACIPVIVGRRHRLDAFIIKYQKSIIKMQEEA